MAQGAWPLFFVSGSWSLCLCIFLAPGARHMAHGASSHGGVFAFVFSCFLLSAHGVSLSRRTQDHFELHITCSMSPEN